MRTEDEKKELTPEEKEAAIKEALKKRQAAAGAQKSKGDAVLGAKLEKQERKQKAKKGKNDDRDR